MQAQLPQLFEDALQGFFSQKIQVLAMGVSLVHHSPQSWCTSGSSMSTDSESVLCKRHQHFFGEEPLEIQRSLYRVFPAARGYADKELDPDRFRAVLLLALTQAHHEKTILFTPPTIERWAVDQLNSAADLIFQRVKVMTGDRKALALYLGKTFKQVFLANRLLQASEAPKRWVSFGFDLSDPVPEWVPPALVPL